MKPLMQYVDVCIGNEGDAELCLGFKPDADVEGSKTDAEGYKGIFKAMAKEFGFKYVISTLRESFSATTTAGSNDLQRRGILRVKALRHQSYHRPRRWRRLFLRWYHPRPADKTQPGCRPRICSSRFRLEAHYQR